MEKTYLNNCELLSEQTAPAIPRRRKPSYRKKFRACKRTWLRAVLFGIPAGILFTLLITGGDVGRGFLGMAALITVPVILTFTAVFGMKATAGYGISRFCGGLIRFGNAPLRFFSGSFVRIGFALTLYGFTCGFMALGYLIFAFLFPIETIYYGIRASAEKPAAKKPAARAARPVAA